MLDEDHYTIGRSPSASIYVPDGKMSRLHCEFYRASDEYYVKDLNSRNGVKVNGEMVEKAKLAGGDIILVGTTVCLFEEKEILSLLEDERVDVSEAADAFREIPDDISGGPGGPGGPGGAGGEDPDDEETKDLGRM